MTSDYQVEVDKVSPAQWDELLGGFDDASVYQSWAYGSVSWGATQLSHLILKRSGVVVAAAQVRLVTVPVIGKGVAYVRWGPLFRRKNVPADCSLFRQALAGLKEEYGMRRGLILRVIPNVYAGDSFEADVRASLASEGLIQDPSDAIYRTLRVDLSASLEDLRKGLHQRWRNKLKNAGNAGYSVIESSAPEAYARFVTAYGEMMARKRFETTVDVNEFGKIHQRLPDELRLLILVCEKESVLLNALVVAAAGETGIYLLAATSDAGLESNGAFLLQWRAMQYLKERGCRWYDMGGINPERNPGVYQFKSGIGGQDTLQLGLFELQGPWLSSVCVATGERLQKTARWLTKAVSTR